MSNRGYYGIGIYNAKMEQNIGTLWRSAYQLGAAFIYTIGARYHKQASDTTAAYRHIPFYQYDTFEQFKDCTPYDSQLIGVEFGGSELGTFKHPRSAIYLLGSEDHGLPEEIQKECQSIVTLAAIRQLSFNVSVAGSIVMYDRVQKGIK
jgi:tRNA G18 (ribose-2'-O)-methylase SpoU